MWLPLLTLRKIYSAKKQAEQAEIQNIQIEGKNGLQEVECS